MQLAKWITLLALVVLSACTATKRAHLMSAQSSADSSLSSDAAVRAPTGSRGDLEPVDDLLCDPLNLLAQRLLLGERPGAFWMLCTPDLGPAYAISIVETNVAQPGTPDLGGDKASYFIRVAKAHERIHEGLDPLSIAVQSIAIDTDAADAILSAGRAVVGRTRYEKPKHFGRGSSHGARFEFQVDHLHGQSLSPEPGFAADLTGLCHDLVECVNMPPAIRANALAKCVETALKLKDDAERAPW